MSLVAMAADEIQMGSGGGSGDSVPSARGRTKKRSTLAKLVEKKRRSSICSQDSKCGSCLSLQDASASAQSSDNILAAQKNISTDHSLASIPLPGFSEADTKPVPRPRRNSRSGGAQVEPSKVGAPGAVPEIDKVTKSPSDATIYRFRNMRIASDQTDLTDNLKQSPFVPKPPVTPRTPRVVATKQTNENGKIETAVAENVQDNEMDAHRMDEKSLGKSVGVNSLQSIGEQEWSPCSPLSVRADSRDPAAQTQDLLQEQYKLMVSGHADGEQLELGQSIAQSQNHRAESVFSDPTDTGPRSGRLAPVTFRNAPPPLNANVTSHTLRTAYKADRGYWAYLSPAHKKHGRPMSDGGSAGLSTAPNDSETSFTSSSVMPVITTMEARSRSYLVGSLGSGVYSLLGAEELERYFPDRRIRIWVGSWNMNELKDISVSLNDFILPLDYEHVQDIYAVGTQENSMNRSEWEIRIQETLGPTHVLLHSTCLGSLHLAIFIRRDLIWFCSEPEDAEVTLRAMSMVKTKGAIATAFSLFGTSFLFINSHLTADRGSSKNESRMLDYHRIIKELHLPRHAKRSSHAQKTDVTSQFDCVFWCGDLNFRLEQRREAVEGKVIQMTSDDSVPHFEDLLHGDQLHRFMVQGKVFEGFQEGRINFPPTFKFDIDTDKYDSSPKNRNPSYTDRVMFRCRKKNHISCLHYNYVKNIRISDHRAVYGLFEAVLRPGRDSQCHNPGNGSVVPGLLPKDQPAAIERTPYPSRWISECSCFTPAAQPVTLHIHANIRLSGGHFDRNVYIEASRRRAMKQTSTGQKNSSVCVVQ